jgi:flagellar biosynthesis GTPase FlhF
MQSMECFNPTYSCSETAARSSTSCPAARNARHWCPHLKGDYGETAARILERVVFTGVGLIFGTRGKVGADPNAHLELEEVAAAHEEFHERQQHTSSTRRPKPKMDEITIPRSQYDELMAAKAKADSADEAASKLATAEETAAELQRKLDAAEVEKKTAVDEKAALQKKVDDFEEKANQATLGKERFAKLGSKFVKALPDAVKTRLEEQAGTLDDDGWDGRLEELAALTNVKADENLDGTEQEPEAGDPEFSREEAAQAGAGAGAGGASTPTPSEDTRRRSVVAGLYKS